MLQPELQAVSLGIAFRPNYAFKPIAEQALRPNQTVVPQRLNAALDVRSSGTSSESTEVKGKDLVGNESVLS